MGQESLANAKETRGTVMHVQRPTAN